MRRSTQKDNKTQKLNHENIISEVEVNDKQQLNKTLAVKVKLSVLKDVANTGVAN